MINSLELTEEEEELIKDLNLMTAKREVFVVNLSEEQLKKADSLEYDKKLGVEREDLVYINAQLESELSVLSTDDQEAYLSDLGISKSGIDKMAKVAYKSLKLISFLTAGKIEVKAWTIIKGSLAPRAAGVIHTDFENKFIKAQVVSVNDFVSNGGWKKSKEVGKVRQEGKDYVMQDGDVVEFMIGS